MPALSYSTKGGINHFVPPVPHGFKVPVRLASGALFDVEFMGFICRHGAVVAGSHFAKIHVEGVTKDDSLSFRGDWRYLNLQNGDYVVGCLVRRSSGFGKGSDLLIYALVDQEGWPMIRSDSYRSRAKASSA